MRIGYDGQINIETGQRIPAIVEDGCNNFHLLKLGRALLEKRRTQRKGVADLWFAGISRSTRVGRIACVTGVAWVATLCCITCIARV